MIRFVLNKRHGSIPGLQRHKNRKRKSMHMKKKDQVVSFKIGREFFGVPIHNVQEIVRVPEIAAVPEMPSFVEGVINLRGKIVSIVDLSKRLKIEASPRAKSSRVLIVEVDNKIIGILVDAVNAILQIPPEAVEPAPDIVTPVGSDYIVGVGKLHDNLIILLDLKNILKSDEIKRLAADESAGTADGSISRPSWETAA
jgi:purine-binding chemotaxis protein CheW